MSVVEETRLARTVRSDRRAGGRTTVDIECPFCQCVTQAFAWSLAGSGKRCSGCRALVHGDGIGSAAATRTQPTDPSPTNHTNGSAS